MGLALRDNTAWLEAMFPYKIEFAARLVNVQPKVVLTKRKEEISAESREEVASLIV